ASRSPAAGADPGARRLARRRVGRLRPADDRGRQVPQAAVARAVAWRQARAADARRARRAAAVLARRLFARLPLPPLREEPAVAAAACGRRAEGAARAGCRRGRRALVARRPPPTSPGDRKSVV